MVSREVLNRRAKRRQLYIIGAVAIIVLVAGAAVWAFYLNNNTGATCIPTAQLTCARFDTSMGTFEVELFRSATPATVANFVNLSQRGFYNGLVWHRIEPGFVIQSGDPTTRNGGGDRSTWGQYSGVQIPFEYNSTLHNYAGYLGIASTGAGVGGSTQFYINLKDNSASLDGKYAVFGKVVSGMNVVQAIGSVQVEQVGGQNEPVDPVFINSVTITAAP